MYDARACFFGFDGNVAQESIWSQFIDKYCIDNRLPPPAIHYKRYKVDELAKNIQIYWNECKISFPKNFKQTKHGEEFCSQLFSFNGKKNTKGKDDAPDAFICAITFLNEIFGVGTSDYSNQLNKYLRGK
jgi:hypothetical protein